MKVFSSNQKLHISGECGCNKNIIGAVKMLLVGYEFRPRYYFYDANGWLHFRSFVCESDKSKLKVVEIQEEDLNENYVVKLIELYFESNKFNNGLNNIYKENGDGGNYKGWEMEINKIENEIIIKPFWAFYHK